MSSRYVAVLQDGQITIHLPGAIGDYATLCAMDGNDDARDVGQSPADVPDGAKVDCPHCWAIWATGSRYRLRDFTTEVSK